MTTTANKIFKIVAFSVISTFFTLNSPVADARAVDNSCKKVEVIFARGSGQKTKDSEYRQFTEQLDQRLESFLKPHHYELGTER